MRSGTLFHSFRTALVLTDMLLLLQFGVSDPLKGHIPIALVVLDNSLARSGDEVRCSDFYTPLFCESIFADVFVNQISAQAVQDVRSHIGSFACLRDVAVVAALPKTRSGKVMRATMQAIAESRPFRMPGTIENESVLWDVRDVLHSIGYADKDSVMAA